MHHWCFERKRYYHSLWRNSCRFFCRPHGTLYALKSHSIKRALLLVLSWCWVWVAVSWPDWAHQLRLSHFPRISNGVPASGNMDYPAVVCMLLYLCSNSCQDIAFAVHQVARYTFRPTCHHELALVWIGQYLNGTKDEVLIMSPTPNLHVDCYSEVSVVLE